MEHAEGSIVIEAPLEDVMEVLEDYEAYPQWAEVRTAQIRQRGEGGRATEVAFEVDVPVLGKATYTLSYRYAPGDTGLSWVTREARGAIRDIRGEYLLNELSDSETKVTYRLAVEIGVLVPGFVRTEGAKRVIENALERLKRRRKHLARQREVDRPARLRQHQLERAVDDRLELHGRAQLVVPLHVLAQHRALVEALLRPVDVEVARARRAFLRDRGTPGRHAFRR